MTPMTKLRGSSEGCWVCCLPARAIHTMVRPSGISHSLIIKAKDTEANGGIPLSQATVGRVHRIDSINQLPYGS
jgi:hypothetical protein